MVRKRAWSLVLGLVLLSSMVAGASLLPQGAEASPYEGDTWIVDASGDGDFTNIQAAITASSPGDVIRVYDGTYLENLWINKRLAIIGNGSDTTMIDGQGLGNVITIASHDVSVIGLNITGSPDHAGIIVNSHDNTVIEDNWIHNNRYGIRASSSTGMLIGNNTVALNDWNGMLLGTLHNSIISDNTFLLHASTSLTLMLSSSGNLVENNTIIDGFIGISVQDSSTQNTLRWNSIHGSSSDGIRITNSFDNAIDNNTMEQNNRGLFIQNSDGNLVTNNTVNENTQGVLVFESHNNTFVGNSFSDDGPIGIELEDSDFNVFEGNTIVDNDDYGIRAVGSIGLRLANNTITGQDDGAYLSSSDGLVFTDNDVVAVNHGLRVMSSSDAYVKGNDISGAEYGISMTFSDNAVIRDNVLTANDFAIYLSSSLFADVRYNHGDSFDAGLRFQSSDYGLASDNVFIGGFYGIARAFSDGADIRHNDLTGNVIGLLVQDSSSENTIAYNSIVGASQEGIAIVNSADNTIKGNDLISNQLGIMVSVGSDGNLLYNNNFLFNNNHATDQGGNRWNETAENGGGNHWQDFSANPGFPDEYQIPFGANIDHLPLISVFDNIRPNADAGGDRTVGQNEAVLLSADGSSDNFGITNHTWMFNDGTVTVTSHLAALIHQFPMVGEFEVTLTVRDASGLEDADTITVTVLDTEMPVAVAGADVLISRGDTVDLNASASTDNVGVTSYNWTFNDGISDVSYEQPVVQHQFNRAGIFTITLKVSDTAGNNGTETRTVSVNLTLTIGPVADDDGLLQGADVSVLHGQAWFNATTDADGMVVLELPPAAGGSNVAVFISMEGYDDVSLITVADADGTLTDLLPTMVAVEDVASDTVLVVAIAAMIFFMAYMMGRFRR